MESEEETPESATAPPPWQQDTLRHTFASYHAKYFRDYSALQMEMGHRTPDLLRTRYLNMRGVTAEQARYFWEVDMPVPGRKISGKRGSKS